VRGRFEGTLSPKMAWVFSGQEPQRARLGRELYETQSTFRSALDRCAAIAANVLDIPLLDVLYGDAAARLQEPEYAQPALFAVEFALSELWRSWGVAPAVVVGDGIGEYVAQTVAGVFSLEDALKLAIARGSQGFDTVARTVVFQTPLIPVVNGDGDANVATLQELGVEISLEIGPAAEWITLAETVARLYAGGVGIDWTGFDGDYQRRKVALPTYPFQRQRYWIDVPHVKARRPVDRTVVDHPAAGTYRLDWIEQTPSNERSSSPAGAWILLRDDPHAAAALKQALTDR